MYLVYFKLNSDGDFYYKDYMNLNYSYKLFEDLSLAKKIIRKHIKTAIDTFKTSKDNKYILNKLKDYYNDKYLQSSIKDDGENDYIFDLDHDFGNPCIHYAIRKIDVFKEKEPKMLAQVVTDKNREYGTEIVYAPTRGKAKSLCLYDLIFDDCEWNDLRAHRFPEYDKYYTGKEKVDFWHNDEHRLRLVKDFGWTCEELNIEDCKKCPATDYCYRY